MRSLFVSIFIAIVRIMSLRRVYIGVVEAVYVRRIRRVAALRAALSLLLRAGNEEQDVRGDRQPVCFIVVAKREN